MTTDEEYLDSLLKSMTEAEQPPRNMEEVMRTMNMEIEVAENNDNTNDGFSLSTDDLADMLDKIEENEVVQPVIEEIRDEVSSSLSDPFEVPVFQDTSEELIIDRDSSGDAVVDDDFIKNLIAQQEASEQMQYEIPVEEAQIQDLLMEASEEVSIQDESSDSPKTEEWSFDIESLLAQADEETVTSENAENDDLMSILTGEKKEWDAVSPAISEDTFEDMDVTEMIDNMEETQNDLLEINDLLKKADSNEYVEVDNADMMALLGAMQGEEIEEESIFWGNDDASGSEDIGLPDELLGIGEKNGSKEKKKKEKNKEKKKGLFGKKDKKTKSTKRNVENESSENAADEAENKKAGRLARFFTYLTQEEDEIDENTEILNQLELEDAEKLNSKKKKDKKLKKKKESNGNQKDKSAQKAEKAAKKQEKRDLREQKKQEKRAGQPVEPSKKVLSRKGMIVLVAFCASVIAAVFALSIFLPDYVDKKEAREAFYAGDYETVYKLLYDKRLDENDRLIYARVEMVLSLQRKLDAYENNKALGRETEALEALLEGVERYHELEGATELGVQSEVDAIYNQMCGILLNNYGLTGEDALTVVRLDDISYSRAVYNLISGVGFAKEKESVAAEENPILQDILPEEEEIINLN